VAEDAGVQPNLPASCQQVKRAFFCPALRQRPQPSSHEQACPASRSSGCAGHFGHEIGWSNIRLQDRRVTVSSTLAFCAGLDTATDLGMASGHATLPRAHTAGPGVVFHMSTRGRFDVPFRCTDLVRRNSAPRVDRSQLRSPHHLALCYRACVSVGWTLQASRLSMILGEVYIFIVPEVPR